jgi:GNAT superfamily N-acetyltransferase
MTRYEVRDFKPEDLDDAARLRAADHRRQRLAMPALDPAYEDEAAMREHVVSLFESADASGVIVSVSGKPVAYVFGAPRTDPRWGRNVFVEDAGFAGVDPEAIREGYGVAARTWYEAGRTNHSVVVNARDAGHIEAWFSLSFGKQHVHALQPRVGPDYKPQRHDGLVIRRKERRDIPALAELGRVVPAHVGTSPTFSFISIPTLEETLAEADEDFADERFHEFVAEHDGNVIATAVGCSLEQSHFTTRLMRPRSAGFLAHAAVLPEGRGLGAGRVLGQTVIAWSRDEGYEWTVTDWRSANLEANRTWLGLGFEPSYFRMHRLIG